MPCHSERRDRDIDTLDPAKVICLGDCFDALAAGGLVDADLLWLTRLMARRDRIWVESNHDAGPTGLGGSQRAAVLVDGIALRQSSIPERLEISGHCHLIARLPGRSARCFLIDDARVILPAYESYVGGLCCNHPDLAALMQADARAVLTGKRCLAMPMRAGR